MKENRITIGNRIAARLLFLIPAALLVLGPAASVSAENDRSEGQNIELEVPEAERNGIYFDDIPVQVRAVSPEGLVRITASIACCAEEHAEPGSGIGTCSRKETYREVLYEWIPPEPETEEKTEPETQSEPETETPGDTETWEMT